MTHDVDSVPALRADRLGKRYRDTWGLRDCSFEVPPGSIVGLVGPNGSGKTTLLALVVSLLAATEGQVEVCGEVSQANSAATLARVSYLAQDHPLYVASLDPLARLDFMRDVLAASAESSLTVVIASHVIAELERLCDWLLVLTPDRVAAAASQPGWVSCSTGFEQLVLAYLRRSPLAAVPDEPVSTPGKAVA